jgi:hypothetical protein
VSRKNGNDGLNFVAHLIVMHPKAGIYYNFRTLDLGHDMGKGRALAHYG